MKLMIVDDEIMMREILSEVFEFDDDVEVLCCQDGSEALTEFHKFNPDVVLLDLMMPDMNGFEVCKTLKDDCHEDLKVIILSGMAGEDVIKKCKEHGADEVHFKPIDIQTLRKAVLG